MMDEAIFLKGKNAFGKSLELIRSRVHRQRLKSYLRSERRPWSYGYAEYRTQCLAEVINDPQIISLFKNASPLPNRYGYRLDARMVEIPWFLSKAIAKSGKLLDAGSSLNSEIVLKSSALANKTIIIITLAPESVCYWSLGISYIFGDIRCLDFREDLFDMIACISTIEHIGMDNSMYLSDAKIYPESDKIDLMLAINELKRVLKPRGVLYITFPFGEYENHGWFQQFDASMADKLIENFDPTQFDETVFRYDPDGWKLSDRASCRHCKFFDVHKSKYFDPTSTIAYPSDYPAGERAVMCLELVK